MAEAADVTSIVGWLATGGLIAWVTAFITLRKDDRSVVIDNVTKERKDWRIYLRQWCSDVSSLALSKKDWDVRAYMRLKSELITRLNPVDHIDYEIINEYEKLDPDKIKIYNKKEVVANLQKKIGCLLKQDWENVKNECNPFYSRIFSFSKMRKSYYCDNDSYRKTVKCAYTDHSEMNEIKFRSFFMAMLPAAFILIINVIFLVWFFNFFQINSALKILIFMPFFICIVRFLMVVHHFFNQGKM